MREAEIIRKTKAALSFAAIGGMRASLFIDTVSDDADMLMGEVLKDAPKSQKNVVERAINEWRKEHEYLKHLQDKIPGVNL